MEELFMASNDGELSFVETDTGILLEQGSQGYISQSDQGHQNVIYTQTSPHVSEQVYIIQQVSQQQKTPQQYTFGSFNSPEILHGEPPTRIIQNVHTGTSNAADVVIQQRSQPIIQVIQQQPPLQISNQQIFQPGHIAVGSQPAQTHITYLQKSITDATGKVCVIRQPVNIATIQRPGIRLATLPQHVPLTDQQVTAIRINSPRSQITSLPSPQLRFLQPPLPLQASGVRQGFSSPYQENYLKQLEHKVAINQRKGSRGKKTGITQQRKSLSEKISSIQAASQHDFSALRSTHAVTPIETSSYRNSVANSQGSPVKLVSGSVTINADKSYSLSIKEEPPKVMTKVTQKKMSLQEYRARSHQVQNAVVKDTALSVSSPHKILDGSVPGQLIIVNNDKLKGKTLTSEAFSATGNRVRVGSGLASQGPSLVFIRNPGRSDGSSNPIVYATPCKMLTQPAPPPAGSNPIPKFITDIAPVVQQTPIKCQQLLLCTNCGIENDSLLFCSNCKYPLSKGTHFIKNIPVKTVAPFNIGTSTITTTIADTKPILQVVAMKPLIPKKEFYVKEPIGKIIPIERKAAQGIKTRSGKNGRGRGKVKAYEEPEILTLSSDDDEEKKSNSEGGEVNSPTMAVVTKNHLPKAVLERLNGKEPTISPDMEDLMDSISNCSVVPVKSDLKFGVTTVSFPCRSIRIGSYKFIPEHNVDIIQADCIKITAPSLTEGGGHITFSVPFCGICRILGHFGNAIPVIFLYLRPTLARIIRKNLNMIDPLKPFLDPTSSDQSHRRITLLPAKWEDGTKQITRELLNLNVVNRVTKNVIKLFLELNLKEANEILVLSSPLEVQGIIRKVVPTHPEAKMLLIYPPPPTRGGITITTDDYVCLEEEQFLNDVILDFYLKWLLLDKLSAENRNRTHIFSTFFYKRLTSKPKKTRRVNCLEDNPDFTPAQKRHSRVKSWTKNVDIFQKDFILIPINEHSHWFLAVICFPGLEGPVTVIDGQPFNPTCEEISANKTPPKPKAKTPIHEEGAWSDRDEAEGDDDELEYEEEEDERANEEETKAANEEIGREPMEVVKEERANKLEEGIKEIGDKKEIDGDEKVDLSPGKDGSGGDLIKVGVEEYKDVVGESVEESQSKGVEVGSINMEAEGGMKETLVKEGVVGMEPGTEGEKSVSKEVEESRLPMNEEMEEMKNELEAKNRQIKRKSDLPPIKQPCILIFDSLAGTHRSRIVATLRDYLEVEYLEKKKVKKSFSKDTMKGACPKVPQQNNFSDCGVFTLQFAEYFFENPLKNFRIPIKSLHYWFTQDEVGCKRESLAMLIKSLMDKYKPNHNVVLPTIRLYTEGSTSQVPMDPTSQVSVAEPVMSAEGCQQVSGNNKRKHEELTSTDYEMTDGVNEIRALNSKPINVNLLDKRNTVPSASGSCCVSLSQNNLVDFTSSVSCRAPIVSYPPLTNENSGVKVTYIPTKTGVTYQPLPFRADSSMPLRVLGDTPALSSQSLVVPYKDTSKSLRRIEICDEDTSEVLLIFNQPDSGEASEVDMEKDTPKSICSIKSANVSSTEKAYGSLPSIFQEPKPTRVTPSVADALFDELLKQSKTSCYAEYDKLSKVSSKVDELPITKHSSKSTDSVKNIMNSREQEMPSEPKVHSKNDVQNSCSQTISSTLLQVSVLGPSDVFKSNLQALGGTYSSTQTPTANSAQQSSSYFPVPSLASQTPSNSGTFSQCTTDLKRDGQSTGIRTTNALLSTSGSEQCTSFAPSLQQPVYTMACKQQECDHVTSTSNLTFEHHLPFKNSSLLSSVSCSASEAEQSPVVTAISNFNTPTSLTGLRVVSDTGFSAKEFGTQTQMVSYTSIPSQHSTTSVPAFANTDLMKLSVMSDVKELNTLHNAPPATITYSGAIQSLLNTNSNIPSGARVNSFNANTLTSKCVLQSSVPLSNIKANSLKSSGALPSLVNINSFTSVGAPQMVNANTFTSVVATQSTLNSNTLTSAVAHQSMANASTFTGIGTPQSTLNANLFTTSGSVQSTFTSSGALQTMANTNSCKSVGTPQLILNAKLLTSSGTIEGIANIATSLGSTQIPVNANAFTSLCSLQSSVPAVAPLNTLNANTFTSVGAAQIPLNTTTLTCSGSLQRSVSVVAPLSTLNANTFTSVGAAQIPFNTNALTTSGSLQRSVPVVAPLSTLNANTFTSVAAVQIPLNTNALTSSDSLQRSVPVVAPLSTLNATTLTSSASLQSSVSVVSPLSTLNANTFSSVGAAQIPLTTNALTFSGSPQRSVPVVAPLSNLNANTFTSVGATSLTPGNLPQSPVNTKAVITLNAPQNASNTKATLQNSTNTLTSSCTNSFTSSGPLRNSSWQDRTLPNSIPETFLQKSSASSQTSSVLPSRLPHLSTQSSSRLAVATETQAFCSQFGQRASISQPSLSKSTLSSSFKSAFVPQANPAMGLSPYSQTNTLPDKITSPNLTFPPQLGSATHSTVVFARHPNFPVARSSISFKSSRPIPTAPSEKTLFSTGEPRATPMASTEPTQITNDSLDLTPMVVESMTPNQKDELSASPRTPTPPPPLQSRTTSSGRTVAIPKRFLDSDEYFSQRKKEKCYEYQPRRRKERGKVLRISKPNLE